MRLPYFVSFLAVFLTNNFPVFGNDVNTDPLCDLRRLVPGQAKSVSAVDITSLEYFPKDEDMRKLNGFGNAILDFTCEKTREWENPVTNKTYILPDQVTSINVERDGGLVQTVTVHQSLDSVRKVLDIHGSGDVGNGTLWGVELNGGYKHTEDTLQSGNYTIIDISAMAIVYSIKYKPYSALAFETVDGIPQMFNQLADSYEEDPSLYNMILDNYGTHYMTSFTMGGYLVMRTLVNTSYLLSEEGQGIYGNIYANFNKMVAGNGSVAFDIRNSSSRVVFDQNTRTNYYYYGGQDGIKSGAMSPEEFKEWIVSVNKEPYLMAATLSPISLLIDKLVIRKQMDLAIEAKLNKAILRRFVDALKLIHKEHDPVVADIWELLSQTVPKLEKILDVKKKVDQLINDSLIPDSHLAPEEVEKLKKNIKKQLNGDGGITID